MKRRPTRGVLRAVLARRRDLGVVFEALCWLGWAALVLRCCSFGRVQIYLRPRVAGRQAHGSVPASLQRVRWAVAACARRLPWPVRCFHQGMAAQRMLCRRGIAAELCYGVRKLPAGSARDSDAHVWVVAGDSVVTGAESAPEFREIMRFKPRSAA